MRLILFVSVYLSTHEYKRINSYLIVNKPQEIILQLAQNNFRSIAQAITLVENELAGSDDLLAQLRFNPTTKILGITGPPGAGKSSLINELIRKILQQNLKVAIVSIDPSSPFNYGALLGDRIRMSEFYLHPDVYIRSLASRGSLGGLNAKIIEVIDVLRACDFDYIVIETVGVGQSEVEIAGIADTTIVVMVPEAGDEVQTMKAGIMEIADIFVVNKSDRDHADIFIKNLKLLSHEKLNDWEIPVIKCIATEAVGIDELLEKINLHHEYFSKSNDKRAYLLCEKAYHLIQQKRMCSIDKKNLWLEIKQLVEAGEFNIYKYVAHFT